VLASEKVGFDVTRLEDIQFLTPIKFYHNLPRKIMWKALVLREANGLVAHVTLESDLVFKNRPTERMLHFSGKVFLEPAAPPEEVTSEPPGWKGRYTLKADDIYRIYFHGPAFQVLEGVQCSGANIVGKLCRNLPPLTGGSSSSEPVTVSTPLLIELCMQTAGIWEAGTTGVLALPSSIGVLRLYRRSPNGMPIYAEVRPGRDAKGGLYFDARVIDGKGRVYLELNDYYTSPLPYGVEKSLLLPLKGLLEG
jgi:Polyketide synthase dehydratase